MSRSSAPVLMLLLPLLLLGAAGETTPDTSCSVKSCAALDVSLLQEYVSGLNVTSTSPDNETELAGLEPFGTLAEDWSRLLLLQRRQPEGTPLRENLLRLSRLMLAAYFEAEDREEQLKVQTNERRQATTSTPTTSEDQQASNITPSPTVQKESTWINASGPYNNENESFGNEGTEVTSSEAALFNRTPSSADNETTPDNESAESLSSTQPSVSSLETSSTASNEVVHVHSEEEFRLQQIQAKAAAQNDESAATADRVKSDESSGERKNIELDDGGNSTLSDEDSYSPDYNSTKSIEEFFAHEDDSNATSSELFNSTESPELLKKSVDEFFANEEQQRLEATDAPGNSTEQLSESEEAFVAGMEEVNSTAEESGLLTESPLDFYFPVDSHGALFDKVTESPSDEQQSTESFSSLKSENSTSSESRTTLPLNETTLGPSNQDSNATLLSKNGSLDFPELISPESNSTEGKNDDNPTTTTTTPLLVELISGGFSSTAYSNEITLESTSSSSSPANGTEDRSEKYRDTSEPTTITSSLTGNTTDKVEDGLELETRSEDATTTDPSLADSATERPAEDNSNPTTEFAPSEAALDLEEVASPPAVRQARKILLTFQDGSSSEEPIAPNVLREPEVLSRLGADTWELKEGAFNPTMASLRNQWRQTRNGIAAAADGMNKRKSRERRIGEPALDAERQYRTFFAREPRRTQFAEKRSEEVQPRQ